MEGNVVARSCRVWYYVMLCYVISCWVMVWYLTVSPVLQIILSFNNMECTVCLCVHTYVCGYLVRWLEGNDIPSTHLYKRYGFVSISCPFWWKRNHNHSSKPSCKKTLFEVCLNLSFNYNTMCPSKGNSSQQKIWATNSARKLTCLKNDVPFEIYNPFFSDSFVHFRGCTPWMMFHIASENLLSQKEINYPTTL